MLQLYSKNRELSSIIQDTRYIDNNIINGRSIHGMGYIYDKNIGDVHLPFVFNDINVIHRTIGVGYSENTINQTHLDALINNINSAYENCDEDKVMVIKVYAHLNIHDEITNAIMNTELISTVPDTIQALYNKCMQQMKDRENITSDVVIKAFQFKGKQGIITLCNIDDMNQASQDFLTLGLIPVMFKNLAARFDEKEIEFFKVLVNRSQVKRISNVKPTEAFDAMLELDKYLDRLIEIRTRNACKQLVEQRLREAQDRLYRCERDAENLLRQYEDTLTAWRTASQACDQIESKTDELLEEVTSALKIEGIKAVHFNGNKIYVTFATPVKFYNTDEVECVINNKSGWITRFLTDVFLDQKYTMTIYSRFGFSFNDSVNFSPPGTVDLDELLRFKAMYNPHTYFYNCLGDYQAQLVKAHANKDILVFMNLALASTRSINFRDGAVINRWCSVLENDQEYRRWDGTSVLDAKCLTDENGNEYSIRELYISPRPIADVEVEDL